MGNAWGGQVGILLAAAHPDRCLSLIALGSLITLGAPVHLRSDSDRRPATASALTET